MSEEQQNSDTSDTLNARIEELSPKQKKFLKEYGECGVVKYACQAARIHRSTFYDWRNRDENFKACLKIFEKDANDTLEYAAFEQSVLGMEEPAISAGQVVYEMEPMLDANGQQVLDKGKPVMRRGPMVKIRKYSPQLLITLLKARMPEKYKDKQQLEHTGPNGDAFHVHVFYPDDEKEKG